MVSLTKRETAVVSQCIKCTKTETVLVKKADLMAWKKGKYIQDAMPYLAVDERELLISGICGECFDNMFPNEDEENYDS